MKKAFIFILVSVALISCKEEKEKVNGSDPVVTLRGNSSEYISIRKGDVEQSDPFLLNDFHIAGDSAYLTVSYSGGCKQHKFDVIWSEVFSETNPPSTGFIINHDAGGDMCEAMITQDLVFNLQGLTDSVHFDTVCVNVINGWAPSDSVSDGGWSSGSDVVFPQGDECLVEVTASRVICGAGLYGNLWLALNDSVNAGLDGYYFKKYLQPVALDQSVTGFEPVQGKKYLIGARLQPDNPYAHAMMCMAYSGPSVAVRITCVTEIE